MNPFDAASPLDARYYFADREFYERLHPYVSEVAQVRYLARVEAALAATLANTTAFAARRPRRRLPAPVRRSPPRRCTRRSGVSSTICGRWSTASASGSAPRRGRAVRPPCSPLPRTSWIRHGQTLCLKEVTSMVLVPALTRLLRQLIALARQHAATRQMGRTHGQHAVPLTLLGLPWAAVRNNAPRPAIGTDRHRWRRPTCAGNSPGPSVPTTPCPCCGPTIRKPWKLRS